MEAQICKLLEDFCMRKLVKEVEVLRTHMVNGVQFHDLTQMSEPELLRLVYSNPYHETLKQAVLILRKLQSYW